MKWIKCSDRMPKHYEDVLLCHNGYIVMSRLINGWGKNSDKVYWAGHAQYGMDYFTHWMELPEPPTKENDQ